MWLLFVFVFVLASLWGCIRLLCFFSPLSVTNMKRKTRWGCVSGGGNGVSGCQRRSGHITGSSCNSCGLTTASPSACVRGLVSFVTTPRRLPQKSEIQIFLHFSFGSRKKRLYILTITQVKWAREDTNFHPQCINLAQSVISVVIRLRGKVEMMSLSVVSTKHFW